MEKRGRNCPPHGKYAKFQLVKESIGYIVVAKTFGKLLETLGNFRETSPELWQSGRIHSDTFGHRSDTSGQITNYLCIWL